MSRRDTIIEQLCLKEGRWKKSISGNRMLASNIKVIEALNLDTSWAAYDVCVAVTPVSDYHINTTPLHPVWASIVYSMHTQIHLLQCHFPVSPWTVVCSCRKACESIILPNCWQYNILDILLQVNNTQTRHMFYGTVDVIVVPRASTAFTSYHLTELEYQLKGCFVMMQ